ncbi:S8 family serine peptidase [Rubrobacter indicoceani]|uniref:S8 family serine peptidase n=1 Tax=Rubrobacter indicoceani TaxID=2051957 RepID=UPI000E5BBAAD|nr:S8 family serine peptidase [Rubrobacter indicoceani]
MTFSRINGGNGRRVVLTCALGGLLGVAVLGVGAAGGEERAAEFVPGEVIVGLSEDATATEAREVVAVGAELGASVEAAVPELDLRVLNLPSEVGVQEAIREYRSVPGVEYAEPNYLVHPVQALPDPDFPKLWGLENTGQTGGKPDADADVTEGWRMFRGGSPVVVAVIDSGVDTEHPDLRRNIWVNPGETPANGVDDDRNGYVDDVNGWDFANNDAGVYDGLQDDHGTHVAGTIAAEAGNGRGVAGVARNTTVMPLKFIEGKSGSVADAIEAINYAVGMGVPVSNNSWGGGGNSLSLKSAIDRANDRGHLFVAAAGNNGANNDGSGASYPASYTSANIISVAATDHFDRLAGFSNYGATQVDLGAPGESVFSTVPGGGYKPYSGTSMATPHVTGAAALLLGANPNLKDEELKAALLDAADRLESLSGKTVTGGRLNAASALSIVSQPPASSAENTESVEAPADTTPPQVDRISPAAGAAVKNRRPQIGAVIRDEGRPVEKGRITLFVDGRQRSFTHTASTGGITFTPSAGLAYGKHTVRVVAADDAGNQVVKSWSFRIVRSR